MSRGRPARSRAGRGTARRLVLRGGAILWVLFTVVAVVAGLAAASSVGSAISGAGSQPRSDAQIRAALGAAATPPRSGASATTAPGNGQPRHPTHHRPHPASTTQGATHGGGNGSTTAPSSTQQPSPPQPTPSTSSGGGQHNGSGGPTGGTGGTGGSEQRATLGSYAGTVVASCTRGSVTLLTWSPALGYRVGDVQRGPSHEAEITFTGDNHREVTMVITCGSDGRPQASVENDSGSGER